MIDRSVRSITRGAAVAAAITLAAAVLGDYAEAFVIAAGLTALTVLLLVVGALPARFGTGLRVGIGVMVAAAMAAVGWAFLAYASSMAGFSGAF